MSKDVEVMRSIKLTHPKSPQLSIVIGVGTKPDVERHPVVMIYTHTEADAIASFHGDDWLSLLEETKRIIARIDPRTEEASDATEERV